MIDPDLDNLITHFSKLPGLGQRSARRIVLHLLKKQQSIMPPFIQSLENVSQNIKTCSVCGNLGTSETCAICLEDRRDASIICVVEDVSDLWALERTHSFKGRYHVLGGTLSALDGVRPEDLRIDSFLKRLDGTVEEIIFALNVTIEGQITVHYIMDKIHDSSIKITRLAHGVPVGGELDYLDDGTLSTALESRQPMLGEAMHKGVVNED